MANSNIIPEFIDTTERDYWFVRTDGGEYFETFYYNKFIAIGWNDVTLASLKKLSEDTIKSSIEKKYIKPKIEAQEKEFKPGTIKAQITGVLNKIKNFNSLKKGDIVIIPSAGSYELAFGIVGDEITYEKFDNSNNCPYAKRRSVRWIKRVKKHELDAKFAYICTPSHAISKIDKDDFQDIIDNSMYNAYYSKGYGNISIHIGSKDDIDYLSLRTMIDNLINLANEYNVANGIDEKIDHTYIKLNVQSPGFLNLKRQGAGLIFALMLMNTACGENVNSTNFDQSETKSMMDNAGLSTDSDTIVFDTQKSINDLHAQFDVADSILRK